MDAADAHPSTKREARNAQSEYDRHLSALKEFVAYAGIAHVDEVKLSIVQKYIDYMRDGLGLEYDSRRHRLLFLRRACAMGSAEWRLPDPLAGFVLDRNDSPADVEVWTPRELCKAAAYLKAKGDKRALAALTLGGFAGLRPSEMLRARIKDFDEESGTIWVGKKVAKNASSRRQIPLPAIAAEWIKEWCSGKDDHFPILIPDRKRRTRPEDAEYGHHELSHWMAPLLAEATGRKLDVKCLRKSFSTWAIAKGVPGSLVDEYMGHKVASVSAVTARHYLAATRLKELRQVAVTIDKDARLLLQKLSTSDHK
jgi:integrase